MLLAIVEGAIEDEPYTVTVTVTAGAHPDVDTAEDDTTAAEDAAADEDVEGE